MLNCPHCGKNLTPHEIGVLNAAIRRTQPQYWGAKLTKQDVNLIRKSKEPIRDLAEKHDVSFTTIWRVKENLAHNDLYELKCPRCGHVLTSKEISKLFATLGGSTSSPRKTRALTANSRKRSKLTEEDVANIRKSNAPTKELARQYGVLLITIRQIRRNEIWKLTPSE